MTNDDIDKLWNQAMDEAVKNGEDFTRYRFANRVAAATAEAEREAFAAMFDDRNVWDEEVGERIRARGNT
jgi:hypothetical protein